MDVQPQDVMTVEQAAAFLTLGRSKVYDLINNHGLPVIHIGRRVIILRPQLAAWLEKLSAAQNGGTR